ncbi:glycosyltransferase 61 family protein [Methylobacterium sp. D48H]
MSAITTNDVASSGDSKIVNDIDDLIAAGVRFAAAGKLQDAVMYFRMATELRPVDFHIAQNLSSVLVRSARYGEAYESLAYIGTKPDALPEELLYFARFCVLLGATEVATAVLQRYIALRPSELPPYILLADALRQRGREQYADLVIAEASRIAEKQQLEGEIPGFETLRHSSGGRKYSRAAVELYVDNISAASRYEESRIKEIAKRLIDGQLFYAVQRLCENIRSATVGQSNSAATISQIMIESISAQITSIKQLEYEVENYGHIDVRQIPLSKTPDIDFLWQSTDLLISQSDSFQRLQMSAALSEEQHFAICRRLLLVGGLVELAEIAAKFDATLLYSSDRIKRLRAFAEYALGNIIPAKIILSCAADSESYIFGGYKSVFEVAVDSKQMFEDRAFEEVSPVSLWFEGTELAMGRKKILGNPSVHVLDNVHLLNDHGTLLAERRFIVRETINCDPGRYIYGWPNVVYSADEKAMLYCPLATTRIEYPVVLAAHSRDQGSFAHWTLDVLPRIIFAALEDEYLDLPIVVTRSLTAWQVEFLEICQIDLSRIVVVDHQFPVEFCRLIVPITTDGLYPFAQSIKFLRSRIEKCWQLSTDKPRRRLYVTRQANFRAVLNDADISEYLISNGFETVVTNGMTVAQQIRLFSEAEIVVAVGGAAVTNVLFMQPGTHVVVIGPSTNYGDYFAHLADSLGISYAAAVGSPLPDLDNSYVGWNFFVSISDIELALGRSFE